MRGEAESAWLQDDELIEERTMFEPADTFSEADTAATTVPATTAISIRPSPASQLTEATHRAALIPKTDVGSALQIADTVIAHVAQSNDPAELERTVSTTKYLTDLLRKETDDIRAINRAAEARLRTCRRLGQVLNEMCPNGGDRKSDLPKVNLNELGINGKRSSLYHRLASPSEEDIDRLFELFRANETELTQAAALRWIAQEKRREAKPSAFAESDKLQGLHSEQYDATPNSIGNHPTDTTGPSDTEDEAKRQEQAAALLDAFDKLSLTQAGHHGDPAATLRKLSDALRPAGCLLLTADQTQTLHEVIAVLKTIDQPDIECLIKEWRGDKCPKNHPAPTVYKIHSALQELASLTGKCKKTESTQTRNAFG